MRTVALIAITLSLMHNPVNADKQEVIFEDGFDGKLAAGWSWIGGDKAKHRVTNKGVEVHHQSFQTGLKRELPSRAKGAFAVEVTLTSLSAPKQQYEQAGLMWFIDGKTKFKFVKERIDGDLYMYPGKKPMTTATVQMRLEVRGEAFTALYQPDGKGEYKEAFSGKLPAAEAGKKEVIGLICFHGPQDAEHWIRWDGFRIVKLGEKE